MFMYSSLVIQSQNLVHLAETSEILVSREFSRIIFSFSLLVLDLEPFQFHFRFSKKGKAIHISLFFLEKKRVKSGAGYNLTSIFVPNCISKDCHIIREAVIYVLAEFVR